MPYTEQEEAWHDQWGGSLQPRGKCCDRCGDWMNEHCKREDGSISVSVRLWEMSGQQILMHPTCAAEHLLATWAYDLGTGCEDVDLSDLTRDEIDLLAHNFYGMGIAV